MIFIPEEPWEDPALEEHFPLGDGVADTAAWVACPCCGQPVEISLDPGGGSRQEYDEDCEVCCRPWLVRVQYDQEGRAEVQVLAADAD